VKFYLVAEGDVSTLSESEAVLFAQCAHQEDSTWNTSEVALCWCESSQEALLLANEFDCERLDYSNKTVGDTTIPVLQAEVFQ